MDWHDSQSKYSVTSEYGEAPSKLRTVKRRRYKPFATSPTFLATILCAVLACIALVEIVLHKGTKDVKSNGKFKTRSMNIIPRQDDSSVSICTDYATQTIYATTTVYGVAGAGDVRRNADNLKRQGLSTTTFTTNGEVTTATETFYFTVTTGFGSILTPAVTCQSTITLYSTITLPVTVYSPTTTPIGTSQVSATSMFPSLTTPSTSTSISSAYPTLTEAVSTTAAYPSLTTPVTATNTAGAYPSLTSPVSSTEQPIEVSSVASGYPSLTTPKTTLKATPTSAYPSITTPRTSSATIPSAVLVVSTSYPSIVSGSGSQMFNSVTGPSASTVYGQPPATTSATPMPDETSSTSEPLSSWTSTTIVYSTSFGINTPSSAFNAAGGKTSSSSSSASASPTIGADNSVTQSELRIGTTFSKLDYFNAMYLPILIAVMLKSIWVVVFASTKMMEPFHQLSKRTGATAEDTLFADYLSTGLSLNSVKAIFQGHWVMALTTGVYALFALVPPLASEAMTVKFLAKCDSEVGRVPCGPAWVVEVSVIRGIEVILGAMAAMMIVLIVLQWRRKTGVMCDPSGIASMASLLHHSDVLSDFREIDTRATSEEFYYCLTGNQYMLGTYERSPGLLRYGLIKTVGTVKMSGSAAVASTRYQALSNPNNHDTRQTPRSLPWGAIRDGTLVLCLLGLLGICIAYYLDAKSDPFNDFFNSGTFGPRFLLVVAATVVDYQWKRLEREVRIMEPFRRLSRRMASPRTTILPSRTGTPFSALPIALWNMDFFVATIAAVAIFSDILIISIAGVPFSSAEIRPASLASFYVSFGILGMMIIALVAIFFWRRGNPVMPRTPDTLASVWSYLCASNMLEDMEGMEFLTEAVRNKGIRGAGRKYFYGMATGSDGKNRYMVAHEESGATVFY